MIMQLEDLMYVVSDFFLAPALLLLVGLFAYSLFAIGAFAYQTFQRRRQQAAYSAVLSNGRFQTPVASVSGYPIASLLLATQQASGQLPSRDQLDVAALKELEGVRNVSRLAPMLGLIATMVPMGPVLKSLADGNVQGISDNLVVAFSAVIFGLVVASITFWIASVKKRWLAIELVDVSPLLDAPHLNAVEEDRREAA